MEVGKTRIIHKDKKIWISTMKSVDSDSIIFTFLGLSHTFNFLGLLFLSPFVCIALVISMGIYIHDIHIRLSDLP